MNTDADRESKYGCEEPGCTAHPSKGDAIHRTTPTGEGQPWRGKCTAHFRGPWNEGNMIASIIEEHNHGG